MSDWWDRHLGVPGGTPQPGSRSRLPGKAVRWEDNYPPVSQPQRGYDDGYPDDLDIPEPDRDALERQRRVQRQGYDIKAPAGKGASSRCPGCGGSNLFRRRWAGTECAPLCTDCGYNGDFFTQSGVLLNGVGFHSSGPSHFARTTNPEGVSTFAADPGVPSDFNVTRVR